MNITSDQYMSLIRTMLNLGGGALISSGVVTGSTMELISGIVLPVSMGLWGLFVHSPAQVVKAGEIVKEKGLA